MDDKMVRVSPESYPGKVGDHAQPFVQACNFMLQMPQRLQNCLKIGSYIGTTTLHSRLVQLSSFMHLVRRSDQEKHQAFINKGCDTNLEVDLDKQLQVSTKNTGWILQNLDKQLQAWKENSSWIDEPPEIQVTVPKGSLSNLHVKFKVGLPPDAIFNILTDPSNRRVFKSIKEVIARRVLVDEGLRQVVEVEQAAEWKFLWWSGVISVHVLVDQNRTNHTVKFVQRKSGFLNKFEGIWTMEPLFIDQHLCSPYKPETLADYESYTESKGRVGSVVSLDQLIQPSIVPPPPISWYLRGITTKVTETLITDLQAEAARIREAGSAIEPMSQLGENEDNIHHTDDANDIKKRWRLRRAPRRQNNHKVLVDNDMSVPRENFDRSSDPS